MGVLCMWVKLLTDFLILGRELHKHAFGGRAQPGPAGGSYSAPPDPLRGRVGREGEERVKLDRSSFLHGINLVRGEINSN